MYISISIDLIHFMNMKIYTELKQDEPKNKFCLQIIIESK